MAAVPLIAAGRLIGVLHTGSETPAFFDGDDLAVMQVVGERIATALFTERTASERSAARILQRSLLPGRLPHVEGIEMASRFVPAAGFGLGGDWFDAFVLPDDRLGIVMGDVTGSGLAAAVVMGRLRSALRAYAIDTATPAEALDKLNRKFLHFEPGQMATVLYLTISPDRDTVTIASAGHPPPIGASPGEEPQFLACTPSPPIGVTSDRPCALTHAAAPTRKRRSCASPTASTSAGPSRSTINSSGSALAVTADRPRDGVQQHHGHHDRLRPRRRRHRPPRAHPHRIGATLRATCRAAMRRSTAPARSLPGVDRGVAVRSNGNGNAEGGDTDRRPTTETPRWGSPLASRSAPRTQGAVRLAVLDGLTTGSGRSGATALLASISIGAADELDVRFRHQLAVSR